MHCENCGAPMRKPNGANYYICDYCFSFHYPEATQSPDNIETLDELTEYKCPLCKIDLKKGFIEDKSVLFCENCKGFLIKTTDLAYVIEVSLPEQQEQTPINRYRKKIRKISEEELKRQVQCPLCGDIMETHPYYGPGQVIIDTCNNCYHVWLDGGELKELIKARQ